MKGPEWRRVEALFGEAAELAGAERESFLAQACAGDEELRREVESLLKHASGEDDWGEAAKQEAVRLLGGEGEPVPGQQIGAWRILRRLGSGGMGTVFEAQRADGLYEQQVALKILRPEHAARRELMRRFLLERQILARLEHPNIARLVDGGLTESGLPYLVMEYVEGARIDEYLRRKNVRIAERIQLMESVLGAVQAAHRNLILHRDLKPANILVTAEGTPKLLDFGIGKILGESGTDGARTQALERMLTPDYGSPEQVRGEAATTATDIYSLGVVLFEMLAGRLPYEVKTTSLLEVEKAIIGREPRSLMGETGGAISGASKEEKADLDAIVRKALRKEPEARYESAAAMAEDLRRFREGFPVEARKGSRRYALKKLIRRHAREFAAATAFVILLAGFGVGMAALAAKVTRERDTARRERVRAERVSSYLQGIFRGADPQKAQGAVLTARELLDESAASVEKDLADEPAAREKVLDSMAQAYQHLGQYDRAIELYEKRARAAGEAYGPASVEVVNALRQWGDTERLRSNLDPAETILRRAKEILDQRTGPVSSEQAHVWNNLGLVLQARGRHVEAERMFREAVGIAARFPEETTEWLTMRSNLGGVLGELGRLEESEAELRGVLDARRKLLGEKHPQVLRSLSRLARSMLRRGDSRGAELLLREALEKSLAVLGEEHLETLSARAQLGLSRLAQGASAEASVLLEQSVKTGERALGPKHLDLLGWKVSLAEMWAAAGRQREALAIAREAEAGLQEKLGPDHPRVIRARGVTEKIATRR